MQSLEESLSLDALRRIDAICLRYEEAWQRGRQPDFDEFLHQNDSEPERAILARQLSALDAHYRDSRVQLTSLVASDSPSARTRFVFTVTEGPHRGRVFRFEEHDSFIVGRSKHAHCRLPAKDEYFSRLHFVLEVNPPLCRLMDMGSANGTLVNGQRVITADLKHGDVIQAGLTMLAVSVEQVADDQELISRDFEAEPAASNKALPLAAIAETEETPMFRLGNFQLLRELERGGMGRVHLALRLSDQRVVALKTILPAVRAGHVAVARFLREVEILRQLRHENIVSFHEMGQEDQRLYFAMDFVPGIDAGRLLKAEGSLPVARAVNLIHQLLEALAFAHEHGYVHCDIKPANLMIATGNGQDQLKVVDFGLARVYQGSKLSGLTMTGHIGGTQAFLAPEQITRFREAKPAADQYAAAATLYTLLTGKYVFDFDAAARDWLAMIVQTEPVPIRARRADIPQALAEIIQRALAKEPARRHASVRHFQKALEPFRG